MSTIREKLQTWLGIEVWHLPEWFSARQIGVSIQASKSPTLTNELRLMVEEGVLEKREFREGHRPLFKYRITEDYRETVFEALEREAQNAQ